MDQNSWRRECLGFFLKGQVFLVTCCEARLEEYFWTKTTAPAMLVSKNHQEVKVKHQLGFGLRKISRLSDVKVMAHSNSFPGRSWVKCSSSKLVKLLPPISVCIP